MIKLDENFSIKGDNYNWILVFQEPRTRKDRKTSLEVEYIAEDEWYYPTLKQCLTKYSDRALKPCKTAEELMSKLKSIENAIENLKM